ncbi:hypothetical protein PPERSA_00228 [Pseudocohnilembus persalinus]|uniref:RyR/IP3R Homology associated domain-containing protein n=1 Tax=Pseudocohnilembus persalinus TaxID=266149 RepID=A0A0V0Q8T2_PSEPJ|nr:hypothetical protein PPERSA_00228 [Pseudocohnilembus persalinus]|eukprot:KRW98640.1 hypothetical protein PPERSA_00228 [Pseudocohnilembus persalinus]
MASYQLTNLIKSLHNLQILTSQFEVELFRNMQQKSIQLTFDGQQSEIWLNDSEKIRSQDYEYQDTIQRVIDTLKYFLNILNLDLDPIQRSSSQEEKISTILSRQIMIRNLDTHHTVINILREANYILKQIKKIGEQDKLILDLFRSCYQFLYFFISSDNLQNKSILTPSLDFFINNLDLADVGQCKLIYELFHDNIQLIQTELDEKLVKKFLKQIENKRYHTRYLDFIWLTLEHTEDLSIYDKKIIEQLLYLSPEYLEENKPISILNLWRNDNQLSELLGDKQKFMTLLKFYEIETMKNPNKIFNFQKYQEELKTKSNNLEFRNIQKDQKIKKSLLNLQKSSIFDKLKKNKQNLEEKVTEEDKEEEKNNESEKKDEQLTDYEKLILESDFTNLFDEYLFYQICYIFPILDMVASGSYSYEITKLMNPLYIYIKKFKDSFKKTPTNKFIENKYILESLIYIKQNSELKLEYKDQSIEDDLETLYLKFSPKNQQIRVKFNSPMAEMLMLQPKGQGNWREIILNIITSKYIKKQLWDEQQELINIILGITEYNQIVKLLTNLMQFVVDTVESQASQDSMNYEKSGQDEVLKNVVVVLRKIIVNCKNADLSQLRKESQIDQKRDLQKKVTISVNRKEDQNLKNHKGYMLLEQADFEKKNQRQLFLTIYLESGIVKMLIQNLCIFDISDQLFLEHIRLANVLLEEGDINIQNVFYDYFINVSASENLFQKIKKYIDAEIQYITKQKNFNQLLDKSVEKLLKQSINGEENIDEDITHIIKFIQLLTEGHNTKLQNYIRVQENSRNSYNILEQLLSLAEILYENLSEQNYHIFMQVFDTIAELIQGPCQENQDYLSDSQFIQICSKILQTSIDIHNVGTKVSPSNNFNSQRKNTGNRFRQLFQQNSTSHQNNALNQQNNQNLNQTQNQNSNQNQQQQLNFTPTKLDIYKKHSKQIFKIRYKYLNSDDSLRLLDIKEVQQQNQIEPITYEMIQVQKWVENINQEFSKKIGEVLLKQEQSFEPWMIRRLQNKMLICLESLTEGNQDDQIIKKLSKQVTFKLLLENLRFVYDQYIQMFRPILSQYRRIKYTQELYKHHTFHLKRPKYTSEFVITNGFKLYGLIKMYTDSANNQDSSHAVIQTIEFSSLDQKNQQNYFYALQFFSKFTGYVEIFNGSQIFKVYFPKPPYCTQSNQEYREDFENKVDRSSTKTKLTSFLESSQDMIDLMKFQQNIKEIKVGQYRIVGIIVWFLAKRVTLLRYFLFSLVLLLIIQYLFSIIAYLAFHQDFIAEDDLGQMVSGCTDLISCWSIMFDSTFKYDGGFVGLFSWDAIQYIESDFVIDWKAIYDFLYNFIILVLVLEMLSGIIIDTFGELRSENEEKEKDRKNYCFICGLNRRDLDHLSAKQSFNEHTSIKHNMWNYLYYIAYIKDKPSTNYTGIETYVAECLKNNDISWFPIDENEENEDQPILEEIQNFSSQIDQMGEK